VAPEVFANPGSPASWNRTFRKGPAGPVITIAQELAPAHPLDRPTTPVPVHGLPGRSTEKPGPAPEHVITWTDRGDTFTILTTDPALTKADLLQIANSLGRWSPGSAPDVASPPRALQLRRPARQTACASA
jgi:hypothetical protein